jgi:hypothetical protein
VGPGDLLDALAGELVVESDALASVGDSGGLVEGFFLALVQDVY